MKLNLGCGYKKLDGYRNIDCDPSVEPDMIADFNNGLPFPDDSISEVLCEQVLEHLDDYKKFMFEIHRVLENGGIAIFSVPEFPCVASIADPDHKRLFVMENFMHFGNPSWFQPTNFSGRGKFDLLEAAIIKWKNKEEPESMAGKYFTELRVKMKKVLPEYWVGRENVPFTYKTAVINRGDNINVF